MHPGDLLGTLDKFRMMYGHPMAYLRVPAMAKSPEISGGGGKIALKMPYMGYTVKSPLKSPPPEISGDFAIAGTRR